ncbi:MAG TPA: bifunctional RNase H/acid phosphatase [Jatrophihabitantaceae bacterium]|nr:bifunctional RNase H/acid phosphatase [Jatrophihabitantaceae bacterium]
MTSEGLHVVVEADGGSRGNPGAAGYGAVVLDATTGEVLAERSEAIGIATNNVAEYSGLIAGLTAADELGARVVAVRMDSKLVVEQMSGRWQVKNSALRDLARVAVDLRGRFDEVTFQWVPREQNKRADRLANEAMDRAAGIEPKRVRAAADAPGPAPAWTPPTTTPTRLVLVRHGSTAHSAERRFSGRNSLDLTEEGSAQAAALAKRAVIWEASAIVSSPLPRAVQTADAIGGSLGLPVTQDDDFAEVDFGAWEGLTFGEARRSHPVELGAWLAAPDSAPPGGESFADVARRVRRGRDSVMRNHPDQTVIVVSHVTPIKSLLRLALEAPPVSMFRIHLDTASVSIIDYFADGNSSIRLVNDTSHLR